jgi:hypothetical protein
MDSDEEAGQLAELLATQADHPSVTVERLAGSNEAVADLESPVVTHLVEGERPQYCFESHADGVGLGDPDATVEPERGGAFLFTDLRVFLLVGLADGDKSLSLPYESVADVDCHPGMDRHRIELAAEETTYHLWIPASFDREAVERAAEYATYRRKQATPDRGSKASASESEGDSDAPQSVHERLERLGDAKSRGLIDEEEFQRRKEELLDE